MILHFGLGMAAAWVVVLNVDFAYSSIIEGGRSGSIE